MPYINVYEYDPNRWDWYEADSPYDGGSVHYVTQEELHDLRCRKEAYDQYQLHLKRLAADKNIRECPRCSYVGICTTCPKCVVPTDLY